MGEVGFVQYDIQKEMPADRVEREWSEQQLMIERKKNKSLGIVERIEVTLARVEVLHRKSRVEGSAVEFDAAIEKLRRAYEYEVRIE